MGRNGELGTVVRLLHEHALSKPHPTLPISPLLRMCIIGVEHYNYVETKGHLKYMEDVQVIYNLAGECVNELLKNADDSVPVTCLVDFYLREERNGKVSDDAKLSPKEIVEHGQIRGPRWHQTWIT